MTYFDRLARRALGHAIPHAVAPRVTSWYDGDGFTPAISQERDVEASLPVVADRTGAPAPTLLGARSAPAPSASSTPSARSDAAPVPAHSPHLPLDHRNPVVAAEMPILTALAPSAREAAVTSPPREARTVLPSQAVPAFTRPSLPPELAAPAAQRAQALAPPATETRSDVIRVHIGRVDVRAVFPTTPTAPAPRRAEPTPAVSLGQFLDRKGNAR